MHKAARLSKLDALTGLRYLAALMVLLSHLSTTLHGRWFFVRVVHSLSLFGMPLFFVLSGFLMTYNYADDLRTGGWRGVRNFAAARFARIYPVYIIALLLSLSHMQNFFHDARDRPLETARCLAATATMTQSWFHSPAFSDYMHSRTVCLAYNGVSWSVSTEMFFYSCFPLLAIFLLWRFQRVSQILWGALAVVMAYVGIDYALTFLPVPAEFAYSGYRWFAYFSPYMRMGEFLVGCLAGRLYMVTAGHVPGRTECRIVNGMMWASIAVCLTACWLPMTFGTLASNLFLNIGSAPFCATIIFVLARYPSGLERWLSRPTLVLFGESSYCMYLLHSLVLSFFGARPICIPR
jgi:peptidoglycan/LPS O-acetylase OafA/YrhL